MTSEAAPLSQSHMPGTPEGLPGPADSWTHLSPGVWLCITPHLYRAAVRRHTAGRGDVAAINTCACSEGVTAVRWPPPLLLHQLTLHTAQKDTAFLRSTYELLKS